jgi:hypothetical protein
MGKPGFPAPLPDPAVIWGDEVAPHSWGYIMVFEKLIRYAGLTVGLKPSAMECEARLRGLERIIYSKTITS